MPRMCKLHILLIIHKYANITQWSRLDFQHFRKALALGHVDMTNQKLHALDIKTKLASLRTAIC